MIFNEESNSRGVAGGSGESKLDFSSEVQAPTLLNVLRQTLSRIQTLISYGGDSNDQNQLVEQTRHLKRLRHYMSNMGLEQLELSIDAIIKQLALIEEEGDKRTERSIEIFRAMIRLCDSLADEEILLEETRIDLDIDRESHIKPTSSIRERIQQRPKTIRIRREDHFDENVIDDLTGFDSGSQKILVVQSDKTVSDRLNESLSQGKKLRIRNASNLEEALKVTREHSIDLVLLDLFLPDSSGLETLTKIRETTGDKPILVCTGLESSSLADQAVETGAEDYLVHHLMPAKTILRCINHAISRRALEKSESRLRAIEDFLSLIAHDIRMPVQAMERVTDHLLKNDLELSPPLMEALTVLKTSNKAVLGRLEKLLELYQFESGAVTPDVKEVDVAECIDDVTARLQQDLPDMPISVDTFAKNVDARLKTDKAMLEKVLYELLKNAVVYNNSDERVSVRIGRSQNELSISFINRANKIDVVAKRGLFRKFWKGQPGVGYVSATGLGLYYSNQILNCLGGKIKCSSNSEYTTFLVRLPLEFGSELPTTVRRKKVSRIKNFKAREP